MTACDFYSWRIPSKYQSFGFFDFWMHANELPWVDFFKLGRCYE